MKPIIEKEKFPKFLRVNEFAAKLPCNKYLLHPWKEGELVKVVPFEQQVSCDKYDHMFKYVQPDNDSMRFRKNYVKVLRKDQNGEWCLSYTSSWKNFDLLTNSKKKK